MSSSTAEVRKLQAAQRSIAISQRAVSSALLEARKSKKSKAKAPARTAKKKKSTPKKKK